MRNANPTSRGTPQHQALLRGVVAHYRSDHRILSVAVFGSLGRDDWDRFSDLDLDVVIADGLQFDTVSAVRVLCDALVAIGEHAALILPQGAEAADVVFASLNHLSIRYHPLATTSPNIVDSLVVLGGPLNTASIVAAGRANRQDTTLPLDELLDMCVRRGLNVDINLQRGHLWRAIAELQSMRELVIELFGAARGGTRALITWQVEASTDLQAALGHTLPEYSTRSIQAALARMFELLEHQLGDITAGRIELKEAHRTVIAGIRARQAALNAPNALL
jgi:predicted nucleotidyltransferase